MEHKSNNDEEKVTGITFFPNASQNLTDRPIPFSFFLYSGIQTLNRAIRRVEIESKKRKRKNRLQRSIKRNKQTDTRLKSFVSYLAFLCTRIYVYIYRLIGELHHVCDFSFLLKATNCRYAVSSSFRK